MDMNRRKFLQTTGMMGAVAVGAIFTGPLKALAETCDKVKPTPQMVTMLGYVAASKTKGQDCANCTQYQGAKGSKEGKCPIFQGCEVQAKGWCKSWSKKA
jgi:hypothetical protein